MCQSWGTRAPRIGTTPQGPHPPVATAAEIRRNHPELRVLPFPCSLSCRRLQRHGPGRSPSLGDPVPNRIINQKQIPPCDSAGGKLLLQAPLKGARKYWETGSSWLSLRLLCAAGTCQAVLGGSGQQDLVCWAQHPPPQRGCGTDGQTASICPERPAYTEEVQDSCLAQGWPQTMPKQLHIKTEV